MKLRWLVTVYEGGGSTMDTLHFAKFATELCSQARASFLFKGYMREVWKLYSDTHSTLLTALKPDNSRYINAYSMSSFINSNSPWFYALQRLYVPTDTDGFLWVAVASRLGAQVIPTLPLAGVRMWWRTTFIAKVWKFRCAIEHITILTGQAHRQHCVFRNSLTRVQRSSDRQNWIPLAFGRSLRSTLTTKPLETLVGMDINPLEVAVLEVAQRSPLTTDLTLESVQIVSSAQFVHYVATLWTDLVDIAGVASSGPVFGMAVSQYGQLLTLCPWMGLLLVSGNVADPFLLEWYVF